MEKSGILDVIYFILSIVVMHLLGFSILDIYKTFIINRRKRTETYFEYFIQE